MFSFVNLLSSSLPRLVPFSVPLLFSFPFFLSLLFCFPHLYSPLLLSHSTFPLLSERERDNVQSHQFHPLQPGSKKLKARCFLSYIWGCLYLILILLNRGLCFSPAYFILCCFCFLHYRLSFSSFLFYLIFSSFYLF